MTVTIETPTTAASPTIDRNLQLKDVLRTLPKECFQKNRYKAWTSVAVSLLAVGLGYLGIATLPWFLLPLAWLFTGTALTGWFVLAHDCGHRSFARRRWVNDWVGHLLMLPLIYPFHSWRILHDHHHVHTNKLEVDNAWEPWRMEAYEQAPRWLRNGYRGLRSRLWWVGSIAHWAGLHFDLSQFSERDRPKVKISIAAVIGFSILFFPTLIWATGFWGLIKFWVMPWLVYHFWMSTFTIVHHTAPNVQFRTPENWHPVEAQLAGTVHCTYPRWVEVLCHDINVHVPHHVSVAIPSYNLRLAHRSLQSNWAEYLQEQRFSWSLMKQIVDHCHLYHPEQAYQPFPKGKR